MSRRLEAGGTITPGETCYNLHFDDAAAESTYTVAVAADGYVAFFAEHVPTEFENDMHYLQGGLSQCMALLVNALSGVSVFIGAAVFLATKPGYGTQGLLLAFSGGVYVYVAATEAAHTFLHKPLSICMKFGVFICFAIGAVAIGLVLLDHEHCSGNEGGSGDGGAHAGHNH